MRLAVPSAPAARAVASLTWRQTRRGALTVLAATAAVSALVATAHDRVLSDPAAVAGLAAIAGNPAVEVLFGRPGDLTDAGAFTVWRVGTVTAVLLATWVVLTTTRLTRGQEESGHAALLLAAPVTARQLLRRRLAVVAAVPVAVGATVSAVLTLVGTAARGALVHGAGVGLLGLLALAVAALCAQVLPTRTAASEAAVLALGAGLALRALADSGPARGPLRWVSPFGLLELSEPYGADRAGPLLLLAGAAVAVGAAAVALAGRRDVGQGLVGRRDRRPGGTGLLTSVEAFAVRRALRPALVWSVAIGAYFLLVGVLARTTTDFLSSDAQVAALAGRAGFGDLARLEGFTATLFTLLAVPVGVFAAVRVAALAAQEADGTLTLLLAGPLTRRRVLLAEVAVTVAAAAVVLAVAALATWGGIRLTGERVPLTAVLAGTGNTLPVVLLCAGASVLAHGAGVRAVAAVGSLPATGGFLLHTLGQSTGGQGAAGRLLERLDAVSPFAHTALVPLHPVDRPAASAMVLVAALLTLAGTRWLHRRDLRG
ncbi:polyketide antibiotic transporter [Kineococcus sp. SYSU DK001]|uniref:polyketide antibiotic transporter n=1 Tax=Kineococcus sp. SYSU DK001 TaxID=3383122 RepID=UPI003D7F1335